MSTPPKTPKAAKAAKAPKAKKAPAKARKATVVSEDVVEAPVEPVGAKPVAAKAAPGKAAASAEDAAMVKRLSEMTDFQLRAYRQSTLRISRDMKHAKSAAAKITLALIETEMARRVASPGSAPSGVRVGVASPKMGKKRD